MAGLCEGGNEPLCSLKARCTNLEGLVFDPSTFLTKRTLFGHALDHSATELRTTSKGGSPIVVPVQSAKSSHVDALVQKQKVSVPKRLMKRASFLTRRTSVKAHPESHRNRSYSADSTQRIFIPHHLQQRINEFLRDNPQGVRIQVFEKEFFSAQTLQNYGVRSGEIQQLLAHLSHILKVSGGMVYPLLEKQSVYRPVTYFPNEDKNPKNFIPSGCENNFVSVEQNGFLEGDIKLTEEDDDDIVAELYEHIGKSNNVLWEINETTSQVTSFVNKEKNVIQSSERSQSEISPPSCAYSNDLVSHQMRRQFMLLLDKNPDGIWCSELPQLYKRIRIVSLVSQHVDATAESLLCAVSACFAVSTILDRGSEAVPTYVSIMKWDRQLRETGSLLSNAEKPAKSIRQASVQLNIPPTTVHTVLHKRFCVCERKAAIHQMITPNDKLERKRFAETMLDKVDNDDTFLTRVCFSDEATFHVSGKVNRHNCRIWGSENPSVVIEHQRIPLNGMFGVGSCVTESLVPISLLKRQSLQTRTWICCNCMLCHNSQMEQFSSKMGLHHTLPTWFAHS
ncbi:hypothetical protein ANN_27193 [Periplaneta americana]|uniref:Uncharacterized protein n=1 Tax=Periplaneta americana TaxID=6978 RepID=A0ABQ8RXJ9_PERAM|nr:hypothetical protein ANN_27193 [Periplaneta americana]